MQTETFVYDKPRVIQALRYHFISRREIKVLIILINLFALFSATLYYFKKVSPAAFLLSSFLWVTLMLLFWHLMPRWVYRRHNTFRQSFQLHWDEQAFTIRQGQASRSWNWNEVQSWLESPHFFHIYFNPRSFFLIPRAAFEGEGEHQFRRALREKSGKQS